MSAPVAAFSVVYANENGTAYRKSAAAEVQEPVPASALLSVCVAINSKTNVPLTKRMLEKLAASIAPSRSAMRQMTEFAANAIIARVVYDSVAIVLAGYCRRFDA